MSYTRATTSLSACCSGCAAGASKCGGASLGATSVAYKFGMSPLLWGLAAAGGVGAYLFMKRKR
jgi:hypothetical protein